MTADGLAGELSGRSTRTEFDHIVSLCDRQLGEPGRRGHLFTWLRPPGAGAEGWLPVDAYYPRHRLVVLYRAQSGPHDELYRELIPKHGLRLLELTPGDIGRTPAGAERALAQRLAALPEPRPVPRQGDDAGSPARANPLARLALRERSAARLRGRTSAPGQSQPPRGDNGPLRPTPRPSSALERGARFAAARHSARTDRRVESPAVGIAVALGLVLVLVVAVVYIASA